MFELLCSDQSDQELVAACNWISSMVLDMVEAAHRYSPLWPAMSELPEFYQVGSRYEDLKRFWMVDKYICSK